MSEDLSQQQWVFHQAGTWDVEEAPEVQFPAEGRLETSLQEVLDAFILFFLIQQGFGRKLVATVVFVSVQTRQLRGHGNIRIHKLNLIYFN